MSIFLTLLLLLLLLALSPLAEVHQGYQKLIPQWVDNLLTSALDLPQLDLPFFRMEQRHELRLIYLILPRILKILLIILLEVHLAYPKDLVPAMVDPFLSGVVHLELSTSNEVLPLMIRVLPDVLLLGENHLEDLVAVVDVVQGKAILKHLFLVLGERGS